jgi:hypothetical protein
MCSLNEVEIFSTSSANGGPDGNRQSPYLLLTQSPPFNLSVISVIRLFYSLVIGGRRATNRAFRPQDQNMRTSRKDIVVGACWLYFGSLVGG